ncbi:uncharacterized protein [Macrobrachium rosenbergii]|uniref:uncharacterized protein n=1 Tax=Macrobrachium rosenbergii TaxID=79674 RepID=UPI0034D4F5A6
MATSTGDRCRFTRPIHLGLAVTLSPTIMANMRSPKRYMVRSPLARAEDEPLLPRNRNKYKEREYREREYREREYRDRESRERTRNRRNHRQGILLPHGLLQQLNCVGFLLSPTSAAEHPRDASTLVVLSLERPRKSLLSLF